MFINSVFVYKSFKFGYLFIYFLHNHFKVHWLDVVIIDG